MNSPKRTCERSSTRSKPKSEVSRPALDRRVRPGAARSHSRDEIQGVETKPNRKAYTVASLFAGMGAFSKAFRDEGFVVRWANENDRFAVQTYSQNFPDTRVHAKS